MSQIWSFEDTDDFLPEFGLIVRLVGLYFSKVRRIEMVDHSHHMLPLRDACDRKIVLHLLDPDLDG